MDSQTVQLPALKGNTFRSPENLEGSYAKALITLELELRDERENPDPNRVPAVSYARATGALQSIARDAIAVAKLQRDLCEDIRQHALELEERIAELEGEDDGDLDYRANLDNTRDLG